MRKESKNQIELNYYLLQLEKTNDPKWAVAICELLTAGKFKMIEQKSNFELTFFPNAKYPGKCKVCGVEYTSANAIFYMCKQGWHAECGSAEDKQNSYYQNWAKRNAVAEQAPAPIVPSVRQDESDESSEFPKYSDDSDDMATDENGRVLM